MVYEEDIWNFMYVFIFRKILYCSNLVFATEASTGIHLLPLKKQPKERRDSFWFTVSRISAYGYLAILLLVPWLWGRAPRPGRSRCESKVLIWWWSREQQRARDEVHSLTGMLLWPAAKAQPSVFLHLPTVPPDYNCIWINPLMRSELFWSSYFLKAHQLKATP